MAELLKMSLEGLPDRINQVEAMLERARDASPVFEWAHPVFLAEVHEQFETEGAYFTGGTWAPLNPVYAARRAREYPEARGILWRTGRLHDSLTAEGHEEQIKIIRPQTAAFGSRVPYGKYHQKGTKKMLQRPILAVRDAFKKILNQVHLAYILRGRLPQEFRR